MQMVSGARGGPLGLIFRGSLWRDPPGTALLVVETLHRRLLLARRVARRSKADFFSAYIMEHLQKAGNTLPCSCCKARVVPCRVDSARGFR